MKYINYISLMFIGLLIGGTMHYQYSKPKSQSKIELYEALVGHFDEMEFVNNLFSFEKFKNITCTHKLQNNIECLGLLKIEETTVIYKSVLHNRFYTCEVAQKQFLDRTSFNCTNTSENNNNYKIIETEPFYTKQEYLNRIQETVSYFRLEYLKYDKYFDEEIAADFAETYINTYSKLINPKHNKG